MKKTLHFVCIVWLVIASGFLQQIHAQSLTHSYTFESGTYDIATKTVNDVVGTANGTIIGNNWVIDNGSFQSINSEPAGSTPPTAPSNAVSGAYISLDGTALALGTYSAITLEAYISTTLDMNAPNRWSCLGYFGGITGATSFMLQTETGSGTSAKAGINNSIFAIGPEPGPKEIHHYVATLIPSTAIDAGSVNLYIDGTLAQSTVLAINSYNNAVSAIATTNALIGRSAWNDFMYTGRIHEFNIYNGALDATAVAARYAARDTRLATLIVNVGTLKPAFVAGLNNYGVVLPVGTTSLDVTATASQVGFTVSGAGTSDVSGDNGKIIVKANTPGAVPYVINWSKDVNPVLTHSYTFNDGTAKDVIGGASYDGTLKGAGAISNGVYTTTAASNYTSGTSQYISLNAKVLALSKYPALSIESVFKYSSGGFVSYYGNQTLAAGVDYLFTQTSNATTSCYKYREPWNLGTGAASTELANGKAHHVVSIMTNDSIYLYQDGVFKTKTLLSDVQKLFNLKDSVAYLARSGYPGDNNSIGSIGEFNIWKGKLDAVTIASRATSYVKDATLSTLTLTATPATALTFTFNPATTTYNVNVPVGTTSVTVGATANKEFATLTGAGVISLNPAGTASIVVTSGDGTTTKTYTVNFVPPVPAISVAESSLTFDSESSLEKTITVSSANLTESIVITAPAGFTVNPSTVVANTTGSIVTVTYDGNTTTSGVNITLTSAGATTQNVSLTGTSYKGCFTPLYASGNMIADPTFSAATLMEGGFGGWGILGRRITHTRQYCGKGAVYILGTCWENGGSLDRALTTANGNALKPNTKYRLRAMVNSQASAGKTFQFQIEGVNGTASQYFQIGNTNGWKQFDTTFVTGATVTEHGIYFNSCTNPPAITDTCFIDNYELYEAPAIAVSSLSLTYAGASTKKIAVTAHKLTSDITITAPTGFSVTPSTMLSTVAGDSVAITYNGGANASGYVYFTSGTTKDSVQVTGTADPTILASLKYLTFDEQNTQGTFTVNAGNLTSGITITAPAGYTVNPSTLSSTANGATVTITYNGLTESKGYITLTSGTTKARVRVLGSVFTPLYATGNLISDPSFNSISNYEGWGDAPGKIITKDTMEVYSGVSSLKMTGSCSASTNYKLTGKVQPNTKYRLRVMAKTTGKFKVIAGNFNLVATGNDDYIITDLNTNGEWKQIDTTFSSGSSFVAANQYLYINSCEGYAGTLALIDNYELYVAPGMAINPKSLTFAGGSTKKVAVTGSMLTNDITITAPAGFAVMPSTLFSTVAGDSVAITYNNAADISGYVVFKSGSVKDSVQVTGTSLSSDATLSNLSISDGTLSPAFAPGTTNYSVEVPVGTVVVPTITTATATEAHATIVIAQTTSVPGSAMVMVTAQDGTTKKSYTINFTLGAPAAPVAGAATTVAKKSFSANWAASTGATGYFLDVATDNAFTAFVIGYNNLNVGNVTAYSVTDLAAATTYYYRVRATNGKVSASSNTISVLSLGTDVQSLAANGLGIAVTANAVELESNNAILSVQVVNVNGTLMTEKSVNATKANIGTEGWASGIYVFTIRTQSQVITTKLGIVK